MRVTIIWQLNQNAMTDCSFDWYFCFCKNTNTQTKDEQNLKINEQSIECHNYISLSFKMTCKFTKWTYFVTFSSVIRTKLFLALENNLENEWMDVILLSLAGSPKTTTQGASMPSI